MTKGFDLTWAFDPYDVPKTWLDPVRFVSLYTSQAPPKPRQPSKWDLAQAEGTRRRRHFEAFLDVADHHEPEPPGLTLTPRTQRRTVYRVEDMDGVGPYTSAGASRYRCHLRSRHFELPPPEQINFGERCALVTLDDLIAWFEDDPYSYDGEGSRFGTLRRLHEEGMIVAEWVADVHLIGPPDRHGQVVFDDRFAVRVKRWAIPEVIQLAVLVD